jgi:hypothetical protein
VFENRALRRIFGPKRDEVTGGWRKLRNEVLCNFCSLPDIIKIIKSRMRWGHGEIRYAYKILVGKSRGKSPLGRAGHRREDNILCLWVSYDSQCKEQLFS